MQIAIVLIGILFLVLLIAYFRLNTFISFVLVALGLGLAFGLPIEEVSKSHPKRNRGDVGFSGHHFRFWGDVGKTGG
ncbi:MAG: hypothetical protein R2825_16440 [Saprospiraceae bacterium]